jgi:hypothetical protein
MDDIGRLAHQGLGTANPENSLIGIHCGARLCVIIHLNTLTVVWCPSCKTDHDEAEVSEYAGNEIVEQSTCHIAKEILVQERESKYADYPKQQAEILD